MTPPSLDTNIIIYPYKKLCDKINSILLGLFLIGFLLVGSKWDRSKNLGSIIGISSEMQNYIWFSMLILLSVVLIIYIVSKRFREIGFMTFDCEKRTITIEKTDLKKILSLQTIDKINLNEKFIPYLFESDIIKNEIYFQLENEKLEFNIKYTVPEYKILNEVIKYINDLKRSPT